MKEQGYWLHVSRPIDCIVAVMKSLPNGGRLSLEGDLSRCDTSSLVTVTAVEEPTLLRCCLWPRLAFVVIRFDADSVEQIRCQLLNSCGIATNVIHIQIARDDRIVFGAYDNFHRDCVWLGETLQEGLVQQLVASGILRGYLQGETEI